MSRTSRLTSLQQIWENIWNIDYNFFIFLVPPLYYPFLSTRSLPTSPLTFSKLPPFYFPVLVFLKTSAMIRRENMVFVFLSLARFNPVISSSISFSSNNTVLFFEMNNMPQRVYLSYSTVLHLPAAGHSG